MGTARWQDIVLPAFPPEVQLERESSGRRSRRRELREDKIFAENLTRRGEESKGWVSVGRVLSMASRKADAWRCRLFCRHPWPSPPRGPLISLHGPSRFNLPSRPDLVVYHSAPLVVRYALYRAHVFPYKQLVVCMNDLKQ